MRVCGKRCHTARGSRCACWCGGAFHGQGGSTARAELLESCRQAGLPELIPTTAEKFSRVRAALKLRGRVLFRGPDVRQEDLPFAI